MTIRLRTVQNELSPSQTQQVIGSHQAQHALMVYFPAPLSEFNMHATIAVRRPLQRDALKVTA